MLSWGPGTKIFVAREPVDMRRGHDGLCKVAESVLKGDPYSGHYFLFFGKRLDRIKVLFWDRDGFVLYYKRLAKGRFRMPVLSPEQVSIELDGAQLSMLLGDLFQRDIIIFPIGVAIAVDCWMAEMLKHLLPRVIDFLIEASGGKPAKIAVASGMIPQLMATSHDLLEACPVIHRGSNSEVTQREEKSSWQFEFIEEWERDLWMAGSPVIQGDRCRRAFAVSPILNSCLIDAHKEVLAGS